MDKFIYVFDTAARDKLSNAGFLLLKSDERNSVYVFSNDSSLRFALDAVDVSFIMSDTLTF